MLLAVGFGSDRSILDRLVTYEIGYRKTTLLTVQAHHFATNAFSRIKH